MTTTNRILVLDTNLVHGARCDELRALTERGFVLRVSAIAIEERLARSSRAGIGQLRQRLRNISPFIDAANPIAPQGGPLYARLGINDPDPARRRTNDSYNAALSGMWVNLIGTGELHGWQHLAEGMDSSIDRSATLVRCALESQAAIPRDGVTYGAVLRELRATLAGHPVVHRFGHSRIDAYICRLARMIFDVPQQPTDNDIEDLALLEHLAEDVILLTRDTGSILAVDATASLQAPFVRTPSEVLGGLLPDGPPWGPSAAAAAATHACRTRRSLNALANSAQQRVSGQEALT